MQSDTPLTVTELTARIKRLFQADEFRAVRLVGEISNFKHHLGRHMYFRLKDAGAQIACAFYHPANTRLGFVPRDGIQVQATGYVGVYELRGEYQFYVRTLEEAGTGERFRQLEALKKRLREEGLTDPARKRPLPAFPARIGIVASAESAGLQDMLTALRRRWPLAEVVLVPVAVEGEASAPSIAAGLRLMAERGRADVVITGRGGGSIESLWGFNTEIVARAIAAMPVPVVTAVGHETDTTVADLVADRRAITPTEAIELVTPDAGEMAEVLAGLSRRSARLLERVKVRCADRLALVARSLRSPDRVLDRHTERVARIGERLAVAASRRVEAVRARLRAARDRVAARSPALRIAAYHLRIREAFGALERRGLRAVEAPASRVAAAGARLGALSPDAVLRRGYAVVMARGRAVTRARDLAPGDAFTVRLAEGVMDAVVKDVRGSGSR